jgi:RNA polymerase sigma-70 factor (ECF subfamily)
MCDVNQRWRVADDDALRLALSEALDPVHRYAGRLAGSDRQLAEDLVQDACERLIAAARASTIDEVGVGWFHTVIRHRFIDHLRSTSRLEVGLPDQQPATGAPDESVEWLTGRLSPIERFVLVAHHVDGFGVVDVAEMIGRSEHATESLLATARAHARRLVAPGGARD